MRGNLSGENCTVPVPQNIKDWLEIGDSIAVVLAVLGGLAAGFKWWFTREQAQEEGKKAVEQVNKMATNDLPHLTESSNKTNGHLEEQTKLLINMDKNIALLVDRFPRA